MEAAIDTQFFERLKEIREQKNISLESISQDTRINIQFLKALEEGNLLQIPRVYDKLFFKSYLKALSLDEAEYYNEFLAFRDQLRQDKTTAIMPDIPGESRDKKSRLNYKNLLLMILPILIAVIVIWFLVVNTKSVVTVSDNKLEAIDIRKVVEETKLQMDSSETEKKEEMQAPAASKTLNLAIKAQMRTWFRVIVDNRDTLEYTLPAGNAMNLTAEKTCQFLIGKADGIRLILNSRDLGILGNSGEVVQYLLVDSTGIVAKKNIIPKYTPVANDGN
jgi:cytoskeletal protein RodZ